MLIDRSMAQLALGDNIAPLVNTGAFSSAGTLALLARANAHRPPPNLVLADCLLLAAAARLVDVATREWLHTGRRPLAVAAAAICLAVEVHASLLPRKPSVRETATIMRCSEQTVRLRMRELVRAWLLAVGWLAGWLAGQFACLCKSLVCVLW